MTDVLRFEFEIGTPSALTNPSEETWVTEESSSRRKSTPGDASMRRSIQDLALSMDPNIKIEPEVEDVRQLLSSPSRVHTFLAHTASFRYCRRVYRLGHQIGCRLPKHRGGDTLEVRHLQLHLGAWLIPPLFQASWLTYHRRRTQSQHPHSWFRIGHDTYRALPSGRSAYRPERTKHKEGCPGHAELASCASPRTGVTGQARG